MVLLVLLRLEPIAQEPAYHIFSDTKEFLRIPNFLNVLSNLPFLIVGLIGIYKLNFSNGLKIVTQNKLGYFALFFGVSLVSLGSVYYHLWPSNQTLVWDRLPITIVSMGLFSIVISEFISVKTGKLLLAPLIILGLFTVFYWHITELRGEGDLRYYAVIQFFPMLAIPIILSAFKPRYSGVSFYWWLLLAYVAAKFFELFDQEIHALLIIISGHSLKHIIAAAGLYILLKSYENREII